MKKEKKYYSSLFIQLMVIVLFISLTSPKIYSQAQAQGFSSEGKTNLCTPHTNKTVDSPSTSSWANLSAPNDSASHHAESGVLQKESLFNDINDLRITSKIYSQAQAQGFSSEGRSNLCTPHTNNKIDSPSITSWANLSAPINSASHHAELGALQKFTSIKHEEIYTKVDAVVLIKNNSLQSEFVVNPGAEMHHLMLAYNRARNIKINKSEELVHDGEFRRFAIYEPIVYQLIEGDNKKINTHYDIDSEGIVSFDIEEFDRSLPLFIVPSTNEITEFAEYNSKQYNKGLLIEMAKIE